MGDAGDDARAVVVIGVAGREWAFRVNDATSDSDLGLIDAVLRLYLMGARRGLSVRLTYIDDDLRALVELLGLTQCLGL
jgi:hypothetical protein